MLAEAGRGNNDASAREPPAPDLALAQLEGAAACFLCATDPDVRRCAWDLAATLRALHTALLAAAAGRGPARHAHRQRAWAADMGLHVSLVTCLGLFQV